MSLCCRIDWKRFCCRKSDPPSTLGICVRFSVFFFVANNRVKMANQNQNQTSEMKAKAKIIGQELERLQQKCANETEKVYFALWTQTKCILDIEINTLFELTHKTQLEIHIDRRNCVYHGVYGRRIGHRSSRFLFWPFHRTFEGILGAGSIEWQSIGWIYGQFQEDHSDIVPSDCIQTIADGIHLWFVGQMVGVPWTNRMRH